MKHHDSQYGNYTYYPIKQPLEIIPVWIIWSWLLINIAVHKWYDDVTELNSVFNSVGQHLFVL